MNIAYAEPSDCLDIIPALTEQNEITHPLQASLHQSLLDASRLFESDLFAPTNYFKKAGEDFENKVFHSNGTEFVRLTPYVEIGDIVANDGNVVNPDEYRLFISEVYSPTGYYLKWYRSWCNINNFMYSPLTISARWGFNCIPPDVVVAVKSMGCLMFLTNPQNRLGQNSGLDENQEQRLRASYNRVLSNWQDKFHHFNLGIV